MKLTEIRKEDDLYFVGPFWIIGRSLKEINSGNFVILAEKFLVDFDGNVVERVLRSKFTHKGIWEEKYLSKYKVEYSYFPRGRISQKQGKAYLNIPNGLNKDVVIPKIQKEYDIKTDFAMIKDTDPTTGNHYSFLLK